MKIGKFTDFNKLEISPTTNQWWSGLEAAARDAGDTEALKELASRKVVTGKQLQTRGITNDIRDSVRDGMIPSQNLITYRPQITLAQNSWTANADVDRMAFGYTSDFDPLADKVVRAELETSGRASQWCCGIDPTTVSANMIEHSTKLEWYSIGFEMCWTDLLRKKFWVLDQIALYQKLCMEVLIRAKTEVCFWGDPIQAMRGLKQMAVERISLSKPLTEMDYYETYYTMLQLFSASSILEGELGIQKTHALMPSGLDYLFAKIPPTGSCSGVMLKDQLKAALNYKCLSTDYMATAARDGSAAMFLYNRDRRDINWNVGFAPTMLAPTFECGILKFQWVMRVGELDAMYPNAGLMIENILPKYC